MSVVTVNYIKNNILSSELELIKKIIPKKYNMCKDYKSDVVKNLTLLGNVLIYNNLTKNENDIRYSKLKKPYIENGDYFNISHSGEYVVFVKSKEKIGIDIETINKKHLDIIDYAFAEEEREYIENGKDELSVEERLTKFWTIKEALFKASGSDKYYEPKQIVVSNDRVNSFLDEKYYINTGKFENYFISVASKIEYDGIELIEDNINKV